MINLEEIFRKMCLIRYFELKVAEEVKKGLITLPVYLSAGQEAISATISMLTKGYAVFGQHRCHSIYISYGGNLERLVAELYGRETGCCGGRGGSPCIRDVNVGVFGYHRLIGEQIHLATGYTLATKRPTVVYFGDAAAEEDYALASYGFAATHKLPILYVCEDNGLSILTPIKERRSWNVFDVTKAMGLESESIEDDPKKIFQVTEKLLKNLPAFINVSTLRHLWHLGGNNDGPPAYDRLEIVKKSISNAKEIEDKEKACVEKLWQKL